MTMPSVDPMPGVGVIELSLLASMSCVDHMLGGPGTELQPVRPLSDIEGTIINGLVDRLLGEMRYALAGIVALDSKVNVKEYSQQLAQVAGDRKSVVEGRRVLVRVSSGCRRSIKK